MNRSVLRCAFSLLLLSNYAISSPLEIISQTQNTTPSTSEVIVVTASKSEQLLSDVSRSIEVVDNVKIEQVQHNHIQQLLNTLPGVNLHRNSGQESLTAIRSPVLTGAGACGGFLTLENGLAIRPASFCNVNELFETHHEVANKIEVMKGVAPAYYGSNALHGVINVLTPNPEPQVSLSFDDLGSRKLSIISGNDSLSMATTFAQSDGFRDSSGYDNQKVSINHRYSNEQFDLDSYFTGFNIDQKTAGYLVGTGAYKDKRRITENPNPEAFRKASGFRFHQAYRLETGQTITPFLRHSKMEFLQHFLPGQPIEKSRQTSAGLNLLSVHNIAGGELTFGTDFELARIKLQETQESEITGSAFLNATIPAGKHYDYQVDTISVAPYINYRVRLIERLVIEIGLRSEFIELDYDNKMLTGRTDEFGVPCGFGGCRFSRPADAEESFSNVSPKLSALIQHTDNSSFYISFMEGFRTPQTTELFRLQRKQEIADLKPTNLSGVDAGWRYSKDTLRVEVGVYDYLKKNETVRDSDFFYISGAKTSHKGFELAVDVALTENLTLRSNVSIERHRYENNPNLSDANIKGLDVDTSPRLLGNVGLSYQLQDLATQLQFDYVDEYFTDVENLHQYEGHSLLHWRVQYQLNNKVKLGFNVNNLLDERYAERADYSGFSGERYFPGMPRHISASIRYSF